MKAVPEEEDKKLTDVLETAKPKVEFYRRVGRALVRRHTVSLQQNWSGPNCPLSVTIVGRAFKATGTYDVGPNALALALYPAATRSAVKYAMEYVGTISGGLIEGIVKSERLGDTQSSILSAAVTGTRFLMVLNDDNRTLQVMENPEEIKPRFYSIRAL